MDQKFFRPIFASWDINKPLGYSLIEMLFVIFVVSIIATTVVVNFRHGQQEDALRFAGNLVQTDLRKIDSDSLSGAIASDGTFPAGGYGMLLSTTTPEEYQIFGDKDANRTFAVGELVRTVELPRDVIIADISTAAVVNITIQPPTPDRYVNGSESSTEIQILLEHTQLDKCRLVRYQPATGFADDGVDDNCAL